jgi:hypothetical protein
MTTKITPSSELIRLLHQFDAVSLGEGDVAAGANVLAAKCISLANLSPPGSCLITPEGAHLPVGLSFMTAGGLTNSLVCEKVLNPIAMIQNNLGDHLAEDAALSARKLAAMSPQEHARTRPEAPQNCSSIGQLRMELDPNGISAPVRDSSPFRRLLGPSSHLDLGELAATPAVFLSGDSVAGLAKQLSHSHRRYPFVRAVLTDGGGMEGLEPLLLSVMRGTGLQSGVTTPVYVRGHVAASCSADKLTQSKETGQESLLANLLWLVDGDGGQLSVEKPANGGPVPCKPHINYAEALQGAWATRLDYRRTTPPTISYNWVPGQRHWAEFLKKHEARCPGLILAARPLFGTLIFGLLKLSVGQKAGRPGWTDAGALAFAKHLVSRMVQCREQLIQTKRDARVLDLAMKIVLKLETGPLGARAIVRKMHRLPIADCREVLGLLNRLGIARGVDDEKWELTLPTAQAMKTIHNHHYLNV